MNLVFIALETQDPDHLIEVGAIKVTDGKPVAVYHSFARPEREILPADEVLFGVTNNHLVGAPPAEQVIKEVLKFMEGCLVVTYSPEELAVAILSKAEANGFPDFRVETLELLPIADKKLPMSKGYPSLYNVADYFGVYDPRTDCLSRAIVMKKLYFEFGLPY